MNKIVSFFKLGAFHGLSSDEKTMYPGFLEALDSQKGGEDLKRNIVQAMAVRGNSEFKTTGEFNSKPKVVNGAFLEIDGGEIWINANVSGRAPNRVIASDK